LKFNAEAKKIKINLQLAKTPEITIDPKRFREVIMNLVSNAVKYNRTNGVVDINMKADKEWIRIMIEDNGIGVPKGDLHRVFSKFFRAKNAVVSETEGSGLGLYVVQKFVEGWGGKISIESKEGKGTKVILLLPIDIKHNK
jgi:signal transduction histidine kinase